jgi:KUP system potassium uptake protein
LTLSHLSVKSGQPHWYPIALGTFAFVVMVTWRAGRNALRRYIERTRKPLAEFMAEYEAMNLYRHGGTCVYLAHYDDFMPAPVVDFAHYTQCLPGRVILLIPNPETVPHVDPVDEAPTLEKLPHGFYLLRAPYGYRDEPDLVAWVDRFRAEFGPEFHSERVLYYLVVPEIVMHRGSRLPGSWRAPQLIQRLFQFLTRNAHSEFDVCRVPEERSIEIIRRVSL